MKRSCRFAALLAVVAVALLFVRLSETGLARPAGGHVQTRHHRVCRRSPAPAAACRPKHPDHRVEVRVRTLSDPQDGWLRIEVIHPDAPGAWATGAFIRQKNKILIETENVDEFSIRLPQLHVNWDRRVILRIDGHSSELKWKRRPILHLRRSPAGSWDVVEP